MNTLSKDYFSLVGSTLEHKYLVECVVADKGSSVTYRARQLQHDRRVVLEVRRPPMALTPAQHEFFLQSFLREAKALSKLEHPGMVRTFDFGQSTLPRVGTVAWTATEWPTGITLASELEERRKWNGRTPRQALDLLRPVLEALAFVHEHGIAHRNVEPAKLVRVTGRAEPVLKLSDFALATEQDMEALAGTDSARTERVADVFSLAYAAPEQLEGTRTGPWTDVHAAALVLTELLLDAPPYAGATDAALREAVKNPARPTPGRRANKLSVWEPVLERALALNPAERYADASKLIAALELALDPRLAEQVPAPPPAPLPASPSLQPGAPPSFELKRAGVELPRFPLGLLALALALVPALAAWWVLLRQVAVSDELMRAVSAPASPAVWGGAAATSALVGLLLLLYGAATEPAGAALMFAGLGALGVGVWAGSSVVAMLSGFHALAEKLMPWCVALVGVGLGVRALASGYGPWQRREGSRFGATLLLIAGWFLLVVSLRTADRRGWLEKVLPGMHANAPVRAAAARPRGVPVAPAVVSVVRDAGAPVVEAGAPVLMIRPARRR